MTEPRYPFDPVLTLLEARGVNTGEQIATVCGVKRPAVVKWLKRGLTPWTADRVAVAVGLHPSIIWPEWNAWVPRTRDEMDRASRNRRKALTRANGGVAPLVGDAKHGTTNAYSGWGCRCAPCKAAHDGARNRRAS